jgi:hypothetical protein
MTPQELAQKMLDMIEQHEQDITGINACSVSYVYKVVALRSAIKELCQGEIDKRQLDEREMQGVIKRLAKYYGDRARIAGKHARECVDQQSMCDRAIAASRWEAKYDAVVKVAENLGIRLETEMLEDDSTTQEEITTNLPFGPTINTDTEA